MSDLDINADGLRFKVEGLNKTLRHLSNAGADAEDMRDLMHAIGMLVVQSARPPVLSGTLSTTARAGRGKTKAVVRAGGARAPYAGVIHYGWPARNIAPQPFLTEALQRNRGAVLQALDAGIGELLHKNKLK